MKIYCSRWAVVEDMCRAKETKGKGSFLFINSAKQGNFLAFSECLMIQCIRRIEVVLSGYL